MNHYAKLATVVTRLVGALLTLIGVMGMVFWFVGGLLLDKTSPELAWQSARVLSAAIFLIVGILIYIAGKPVGRLIGKGLDE